MKTNPIPDRRTFKTAADFLRWLDKRKADKKLAEDKSASRSAMRWADDGGQSVDSREDPQTSPGD